MFKLAALTRCNRVQRRILPQHAQPRRRQRHRQHVVGRRQWQRTTVHEVETDVALMHVAVTDQPPKRMQPRHDLHGFGRQPTRRLQQRTRARPLRSRLTRKRSRKRQQRNKTSPPQHIGAAVEARHFQEGFPARGVRTPAGRPSAVRPPRHRAGRTSRSPRGARRRFPRWR
ncbi:hypothetical protein G6F24_015892 [Rhizopus arrhizus]|nr:hypothetical protein G6F24_015892 [Rhizopus arrhizus]